MASNSVKRRGLLIAGGILSIVAGISHVNWWSVNSGFLSLLHQLWGTARRVVYAVSSRRLAELYFVGS